VKTTLYSASAGTGKTYTICQEIAKRIIAGQNPRRILACTYTKRAASELKSRVQQTLLEKGLTAEASALELAPIGTVHSIGHRYISRFALRLGLSPDLEVLPEGGDLTAMKRIVAGLDPATWEEMVRLQDRLQIGGDEDTRGPLVLRLLGLKRQNAIGDMEFKKQMKANGERFLEVLAPEGPSGRGDFKDAEGQARGLARDAIEALDKIAGGGKPANREAIIRLARFGASNWYTLTKCSQLSAPKKAEDEDRAIAGLRSFCAGLRRHPGLISDCRRFMELLTKQVLEVEREYSRYKTARGLLDYTDMEERFYQLASDPDFAKDLKAEMDLVIVDEFQDTNPVQLAIFLKLRDLVQECIWVGDLKQTIFAFTGAAPDLMRAVWGMKGVVRETLGTNRRSLKGIVDVANAVFAPVFGEDSKMKAHEAAGDEAMERWLLRAGSNPTEAQAVAAGVKDLVRRKKVPLSDIAVLVRQNKAAGAAADALIAEGIPAALKVSGLLATRECAAVLCGLRLVADRTDSLAAATLIQLLEHTGDGTPAWLSDRLKERKNGKPSRPFAGRTLFAGLEKLDSRHLSPSGAVSAVIEALGITSRLGDWDEPDKRATELDALRAQAEAFEETALSAGGSATLTGLIAYLEEIEASGEDGREPPQGLDAVQVLTYHSAKGLEWPIVILTQLDTVWGGTPFDLSVSGGSPAKGMPLEGRKIHYWPHPFSGFKALSLSDDALQTPEGLAASDQDREENKRLLYVGFTRPKGLLVLATRLKTLKAGPQHRHAWLDNLGSFDSTVGRFNSPGMHAMKGIAGGIRVFSYAPSDLPVGGKIPAKQFWLDTPKAGKSPEPRYVYPSEAKGGKARFRLEALSGAAAFDGKAGALDPVAMGNALHAYFSALLSLETADEKAKGKVARRCLEGFEMEGKLGPSVLVRAGDRLMAWLKVAYPAARIFTEVAVSAPAKDGAQWDGAVDLLVEVSAGRVVVLDHKSFFGKDEHLLERADEYCGQLRAYEEGLRGCGFKVEGAGLHLPLAGRIAMLEG